MKMRVGSLVVMRRGLCEDEGDEEEVSGRFRKGGEDRARLYCSNEA